MVTVDPEPDAVIEPGSAVAPVSEAQEAEETVWVALTAPDEPVQVVASAPLKFTDTDVAPEPTVLNTNLKLL